MQSILLSKAPDPQTVVWHGHWQKAPGRKLLREAREFLENTFRMRNMIEMRLKPNRAVSSAKKHVSGSILCKKWAAYQNKSTMLTMLTCRNIKQVSHNVCFSLMHICGSGDIRKTVSQRLYLLKQALLQRSSLLSKQNHSSKDNKCTWAFLMEDIDWLLSG